MGDLERSQRLVRTTHLVGGFALLTTWAAVAGAQPTSPPSRIQSIACGAPSAVSTPALRWDGDARTGLRWSRWRVALGAHGVSVTMVIAEIDPSRIALALEVARQGDALAPWSIDAAPDSARIAFNAGQFTDAGPWGWVVHRGREWQAPAPGAYAGAFVVDSMGRAAVLSAQALPAERARGVWREALQSYPTILEGGRAPAALCGTNPVDTTHRDIRLAIGTRTEGRVLVVLSRYAGVGTMGERVPIGPTMGEMAEVMRRLGVRDALMLDGGLSAQLLVRSGARTERWDGLRRVPLALIGAPRRR